MRKEYPLKRFIGVNYSVGACNMRCDYCYLGRLDNKIKEIPFSIDDIKKAFSRKRLGGRCFINICADGEPLIHPMIPDIIRVHLEEGHYVSVVTNLTISSALDRILAFDEELLDRLFFKVSFHYEEMERMGTLSSQFKNIKKVIASPCSFSVEYITTDQTMQSDQIERLKKLCKNNIGALPHLNMPRDERRVNLGIASKYSWKNYLQKCDSFGFESNFFDFRRQVFGKKYKGFCYSGVRHLWINMSNGYSYQCYDLPRLQDFMGELDKPARYLAVGHNCPQAHCYVAYTFMPMGVAPFPEEIEYKPSYDEIRNRRCIDGSYWIKPKFEKAFRAGVSGNEYGMLIRRIIDIINKARIWRMRRQEENG